MFKGGEEVQASLVGVLQKLNLAFFLVQTKPDLFLHLTTVREADGHHLCSSCVGAPVQCGTRA